MVSQSILVPSLIFTVYLHIVIIIHYVVLSSFTQNIIRREGSTLPIASPSKVPSRRAWVLLIAISRQLTPLSSRECLLRCQVLLVQIICKTPNCPVMLIIIVGLPSFPRIEVKGVGSHLVARIAIQHVSSSIVTLIVSAIHTRIPVLFNILLAMKGHYGVYSSPEYTSAIHDMVEVEMKHRVLIAVSLSISRTIRQSPYNCIV